jgi:hypothetical protein
VTAGVDVPGELIGIAPSLVSGRIIGRSAELGVVRRACELGMTVLAGRAVEKDVSVLSLVVERTGSRSAGADGAGMG